MKRVAACVWLSVVALGPGCTKVMEQPAAEPAPAPAPAAAPKPRPGGARPGIPREVRFASDPPAGRLPVPAAPAPPPPAAAAPGTLNGDPKGLVRADLNRVLDGALPSLASCFQGAPPSGSVSLSFDAEPSGKLGNIKVGSAGASAERCVTSALQAVRLPAFEGKPVQVDFPLSIQRGAPPAKPAEPPPPPASPPIFVRP